MGATNRSTLAYVAEVTKGTTPTSPAFKGMRNTSNSMEYKPTRVTSSEIRADRQVTDQILTDLMADGSIGIELSFSAFDDMIEAASQGTWTNKPSITVVTSDTEISDVSTTTLTVVTPLGSAFKAGMLVFTGGFTTSANDGLLARVASSTATTVVFPSATFSAEGAAIPVGAFARVVGFQGASGDITATASGLGSTALDFTTLGLNAGEWVKIGGDVTASQFATAACNGWARIAFGGIAATALTFDVLPASWATDSGTSKTIEVFTGDFLKNGTTQRGFTFERQQQDLTSPSYELFKGCEVNTLSLTYKSAAIITGTIGVTGLTATASTSRASGATDVAAPAYPVLNASSNVGRIAQDGVIVSGPSFITDLSFDLNNNLARQTAVGTLGAVGTRDGELALSGTLNAYFGDLSLLNKVLNDTVTSLMFRSGRSDGNRESILIDVPQAKLEGTAPVSGKNADRSFTGKFDAYRHPTLGFTFSTARYWYLPVAV
jgi:Phage tail tube protein